ncbi:uncharacterized protein LOC134248642 [Saccostrea cucullata]|uniref:uncharacterized protein LOC134248642 n=1 Tax=Saccostrea cuccullata TaxID=36930 RepID=UPI002ED070CE
MSTVRRTRKQTNFTMSNSDNPSNWTVAELKKKLSDNGININVNLSHSILKRIYVDNVLSVQGQQAAADGDRNQANITNDMQTVDNHDISTMRNSVLYSGAPTPSANLAEGARASNIEVYPEPGIPGGRSSSFTSLPPSSTLPTMATSTVTTSAMSESVILSTLQLCQQAITSLTQSNKTNEAKYSLQTAMSTNAGTPAVNISDVDMVSPELRADILADGSFQEAGTRSRSSVYAVSSFNGSDLDSVVENLWDHSISIRTRNQYKVGLDCYIKFTLLRGLHGSVSDLPPMSEQLLIYFVAFCDDHLRLAYSTIKLYLSGIRYFYLRLKGCNPFQNNAGQNLICLQSVLTGVKKKQSMYAVPKRSRLPITMSILTKMCQLLRSGIFDMFTSYMFEAACTVAFFGFLRCGEFTVLSDSHYDDYVSIQDVICHDSFVALTLRKSKTDPFRNGVQIKLFKTQTDVCPVNAVVKYLKLRSEVFKSQPLPFFVTKEGSILTRAIFIDTLKVILSQLGLNSDLYNGHSFRIGAATTAQEARIEDHLIKTLGRWSSNCYTTYIHTSPSVIQNAQQQIASSVL